MLGRSFVSAITFGALAFGCSTELELENNSRIQETIENLLQAGFPASDIMVLDGVVHVGRDAVVALAASREMIKNADSAGKEQYRTDNLVGANITTICVNGAAFSGSFSTALDNAIANYNGLGLRFTMRRTSGSTTGCSATITAVVSTGTGGSSGFPTGGLPFNVINIGSGLTGFAQSTITHVITHELGHTIGFRHSDYYNRSISCGSGGDEGSADVGANLVLATPSNATVGGSIMNSCFRTIETGVFTSTDVFAAKLLYASPRFESQGGGLTSAPAVSSWAPGRLDVFAKGSDNALWHKWFDGGSWSGWESLGGTLASEPTAVSWGSGRIDVFAQGTDNTLIHKWFDSSWSGWESLGGTLASGPAAASWASGRLDVFARGTDSTLVHKWFAGSWSGWESLGGTLASEPAAVSWSLGRIDVFARGTDNTLIHKWFDSSWSGWESLGGSLSSGPAVASWGRGRLDVFAKDSNGILAHLWIDNGPWQSWEELGNTLFSSPAAVSWSTGRIDLFMVGQDGTAWHKWFDGSW